MTHGWLCVRVGRIWAGPPVLALSLERGRAGRWWWVRQGGLGQHASNPSRPPRPKLHAARCHTLPDCLFPPPAPLPLCSLPLALAASQMPAPAAVRLAHVVEGTKAK